MVSRVEDKLVAQIESYRYIVRLIKKEKLSNKELIDNLNSCIEQCSIGLSYEVKSCFLPDIKIKDGDKSE